MDQSPAQSLEDEKAHGDSTSRPAHHVPDPGSRGPLFQNPWDTYEKRSFAHVWEWMGERRRAKVNTDGSLQGIHRPKPEDFKRAFPLNPVDWDALASPPRDAIQAVWVGHATVLVQMGGVTFITDPVFSERCAPVQFMGPKRVVPPAFAPTDPRLPTLDFVLLSHNHYDHLDAGSVDALNRRYGKGLTWYVPLGLRAWFAGRVAGPVVEMDWWQSVQHKSSSNSSTGGQNSVTVTMVPAQHWSARGIMDRFRSLWGGYVVTASPAPATTNTNTSTSTPISASAGGANTQAASHNAAGDTAAAAAAPASGTAAGQQEEQQQQQQQAAASPTASSASPPLSFYFVGDTGYCPVFKEIGKRLGPIDLAAIPIGAYEPRWFMKPQHTNAEEGLQIAQDVRAAVSIGIHTATWCLTDEPLDEPPARLVAAVRAAGLPPSSFVTLQHGEKAVVRAGQLVNTPNTLPVAAEGAGAGAGATA